MSETLSPTPAPGLEALPSAEAFYLPASFAQERLWFLERLGGPGALFNIPAAFRLRGRLDAGALEAALEAVVERHETLRTTFHRQAEGLHQRVTAGPPEVLRKLDLSALPEDDRQAAARREIEREVARPFDLEAGPLLRVLLIRLASDDHFLALTLHHIVGDGWSMGVLFGELAALYGDRIGRRRADLAALPIQYGDYAVWQREELDGPHLEARIETWRQRLDGAPRLLELPTDRARPSVQSHLGKSLERPLPSALGERLQGLARNHRCTAYTVALAAFAALLHHFTGRRDLVFGTALANRLRPELEGLIGFFANTLPVRLGEVGEETFGQLVARARQAIVEIQDDQDLPFDRLVEALAPRRDPSHNPLLQVMFLLDDGTNAFALEGLEVEAEEVTTGTAKYDLAVTFSLHPQGSRLRADFASDLFDGSTIARLLGCFETLLSAALEEPQIAVRDLPTLSPAGRHQMLFEWNDTADAARLEDDLLHAPFERFARRHREAPALRWKGRDTSYGELDGWANRLAHHLRAEGVRRGSLVGVHLHRSPRMVATVLAILKAGGAYVPLDAEWPAERIRWIVEVDQIGHLVAESATLDRVAEVCAGLEPEARPAVVTFDGETDRDDCGPRLTAPTPDLPTTPPRITCGADDQAYTIFTSGSTGRPKGVVVCHRAAVQLVRWVNETFGVGPGEELLFITSLSFDLSVYDIFGILGAGATIRLASEEERADPQSLARILSDEAITFWDSAPAALQQLVPYLKTPQGPPPALRRVFLSGDWIPLPLPGAVQKAFPASRVISLGGATEATVWSNFHAIDELDPDWPSIPYGRPISNARYHVLDDRLRPCPIGVPGDLYIAGECLSLGYAQASALTAGQYIPDPFGARLEGIELRPTGGRLYRTGDRARYHGDGNLEFLGRRDTQVKVRGFRIELGEIEAVLAEHDGVEDALVLVREDTPGNQRLAAYIRPSSLTAPPALGDLEELTKARLPHYMVPSDWLTVESWPLSATGKLDRKALPSPAESAAPKAIAAPTEAAGPEIQQRITAIWSEVLGHGAIDPQASFFDQGGNSLSLGEVHVRLEETFGVEIPMVTLFRFPTIDQLAEMLAEEMDAGAAAPQPEGKPPEPSATGVTGRRERIAAIWRQVLKLDRVEADVSFFDQGGNSLSLGEVHVRLEEAFGIEIPMVTLFRFPTIDQLAEELAEEVPTTPAPVLRAEPERESRAVAVIGLAGRFPGAADTAALWRLFAEGREGIRSFSDEELLANGVTEAELADPLFVRARGALENPDLFDAAFFGLAPREAQALDPQHRLFLETAWQALEVAGYPPGPDAPRIGVFAGASENGYGRALAADPTLRTAIGNFQIGLGNRADYLSTRTSYELDLRGPSLNVQTACSTSLVAVHLARLGLLAGDCDLALAGGVSVALHEITGYSYIEGAIDSPDGRTRAFDADARGAAGGSGVGIVVLKPLDAALADGDTIHAVLLGSAINNDGADKMGFTAPAVSGQASVIAAALEDAGVDAASIGYVEAHGTGTPLGDPIEIAALAQAFGPDLPAGSCAVGSAKTNVGHLDAAAGVTGLIKAILALRHGQIPPSLHFRRPNPQIDFASTPFQVATELKSWPAEGPPRRAGVSSFGIGGTNAHVILEEAPRLGAGDPEAMATSELLALSARSPSALERAAQRLADHLAEESALSAPPTTLRDVAYTLAVGRRSFRHRRTVVAHDRDQAVAALREPGRPRARGAHAADDGPPAIDFVLPGQGAQHLAMAAQLYAELPTFQRHLDETAEILAEKAGLDLLASLFPEDGLADAEERIHRTDVAQPALFAVEHALARVWMEWGVRPRALLGHSLGEITAACLAGVFGLEDALRLVAERGRLMASLEPGAMLALPAAEEQVADWLAPFPDLALAAVNGPRSCVVSGPFEAIDSLAEKLASQGLESRRLKTSHAFHSAMMDPIVEELSDLVATFPRQAPAIPFVSNVTGEWIRPEEAKDPRYWGRHLRSTVRFSAGLESLVEGADSLLLEVGPGTTLSRLVKQTSATTTTLASLPRAAQGEQDLAVLFEAAGQLWSAGARLDWEVFWRGRAGRRVPLPTYPFEARRYWLDVAEPHAAAEPAVEPTEEREQEPALSPTEQVVAQAFENLLGITDVGRQDDFFALGGGSLMSLQLAAVLRRELATEVSSNLLLEASTVGEIAQRLGGPEGPSEAPSCLVNLTRSSLGRSPLFLVHPVGGNVFTFRDLASEIGHQQPIQAFRSHGLEKGEEPFRRIEDMAAHYLELLRAARPKGPYLLGGASMGGMVAFDMARQLLDAGEAVDLVTLMDSPCGDQMPPREANADPVWMVIRDHTGVDLDAATVGEGSTDERFDRALAGLAPEISAEDFDAAGARRLARVIDANIEALYSYRPQPLEVSLLYFRAAERRPADPPRPELPWIELGLGGTETVITPGDHESMHQPPHIATLGRHLWQRLSRRP